VPQHLSTSHAVASKVRHVFAQAFSSRLAAHIDLATRTSVLSSLVSMREFMHNVVNMVPMPPGGEWIDDGREEYLLEIEKNPPSTFEGIRAKQFELLQRKLELRVGEQEYLFIGHALKALEAALVGVSVSEAPQGHERASGWR
jgi:hypothetical protein